MLKSVTTTTTSGDGTVEIPSDFLEARDFYVTGNPPQPLTYLSPSVFIRNTDSHVRGKPLNYTILATEFQSCGKRGDFVRSPVRGGLVLVLPRLRWRFLVRSPARLADGAAFVLAPLQPVHDEPPPVAASRPFRVRLEPGGRLGKLLGEHGTGEGGSPFRAVCVRDALPASIHRPRKGRLRPRAGRLCRLARGNRRSRYVFFFSLLFSSPLL